MRLYLNSKKWNECGGWFQIILYSIFFISSFIFNAFFFVLKELFWNLNKIQKSWNILKEFINWKSNTIMSIQSPTLCGIYEAANFWFEFAAYAAEWFRVQFACDIHLTSYQFLCIICLRCTKMYLEFIYGEQAKLIRFDDEEIENERLFITKGTQFRNLV